MAERPGLTRPEMAARYGVSARTIRRWCAESDWPVPLPDKRGAFEEYDPEEADAAAARRQKRDVGDVATDDRLLTTSEIARLYGLTDSTVRAYASDSSRNILGQPDDVRDGVKLYHAGRVAKIMSGRRRYQRTEHPSA